MRPTIRTRVGGALLGIVHASTGWFVCGSRSHTNDTPDNKRKNRRTVITLQPNIDEILRVPR